MGMDWKYYLQRRQNALWVHHHLQQILHFIIIKHPCLGEADKVVGTASTVSGICESAKEFRRSSVIPRAKIHDTLKQNMILINLANKSKQN